MQVRDLLVVCVACCFVWKEVWEQVTLLSSSSSLSSSSLSGSMPTDTASTTSGRLATPRMEVLDLSRLNLNEGSPALAPQTPTIAKKRRPSCVTPPMHPPAQAWREKRTGAIDDDNAATTVNPCRQQAMPQQRTSMKSAIPMGPRRDDDTCDDGGSSGGSRKRLRRAVGVAGLGLLAPMLPNSPEMEARNDDNPFHRHRPHYSPIGGSTSLNLKFFKALQARLVVEDDPCPAAVPHTRARFVAPVKRLPGRAASVAPTPVAFNAPNQSLPDLEELDEDQPAQLPSRKILKMRPNGIDRMPFFPPANL